MDVKVSVPIKRGQQPVNAELMLDEAGEVKWTIPSVGTQRICKFAVNPEDLSAALKVLNQ
jgi:hypothetical protein